MSVSPSLQNGLEILRAGTLAFIKDDPVKVALTPTNALAVEVPGGGYDYSPMAQRPLQEFKLINQTGDSSAKTESESGITSGTREYVMLGTHDAVVEIGDTWNDGDNRYTVVESLVENGYERKWRVESKGLEPNYG